MDFISKRKPRNRCGFWVSDCRKTPAKALSQGRCFEITEKKSKNIGKAREMG